MPGLRLTPLAAPLALVGAAAAVASWRLDRNVERPTLVLALAAATVLAPLAVSGRARDPIVPGGAVAVFAALALLPGLVPLPTAAVSCALVATLGLALADRSRRDDWESAGALPALAGLVLAAQALASLDELFVAPLAAAHLARVALLPLAVIAALAAVARRRPRAALALGLASWCALPGWGVAATLAVVVGAAAFAVASDAGRAGTATIALALAAALPSAATAPPWIALAIATLAALAAGDDRPGVTRPAIALLGAIALGSGLAGALPWNARRPVERALQLVVRPPFRVVATPVLGRGRTAHAGRPQFEAPFAASGAPTRRVPVGAVEITSYVTNSAALPCGTRVADVVLVEGRRERARFPLRLGLETGEWAAARPDVAAASACPAPPAHWSWIPTEGRFLGSTFHARLEPEAAAVADRLRFELAPGLPDGVAVSIFSAVIER
jgi:hypothetical protein